MNKQHELIKKWLDISESAPPQELAKLAKARYWETSVKFAKAVGIAKAGMTQNERTY